MNLNTYFIPTVIIALLLFFVSRHCWLTKTNKRVRALLLTLGLFLFLPACLYVLYYNHWFDNAVWFYQLRSLPGSELLASGAGILAGVIGGIFKKYKFLSTPFLLCLLVIGVFIPHSKSAILPIDYAGMNDKWKDGVCRQSTGATCGPASAATIMRYLGEIVTEAELAKESYSYVGGTEIWYIARTLRRRGYSCEFKVYSENTYELPYPSIAGIDIGSGHFIAILDKTDGDYVIGDPLTGREEIPAEKILRRITFTGFFLVISK